MALARQNSMRVKRDDGTDSPSDGSADPAAFARTLYRTTTRAADVLGSSSLSMLVMLLDLFVAHEQGRAVSVSSLCIASGAAQTTALRQIGQLEARGLIARRGDDQDRRRCWVSPTQPALDLVRSLSEDWPGVGTA